MKKEDYIKKGWAVVPENGGFFRLKNGSWSKIGGFHTESDAWKWLLRMREPRSTADLRHSENMAQRELARERAFIKANL